jgi:hypothetical protein
MKPEIKDWHCPDVADLARWVPPSQADVFLPLEISIGPAGGTAAELFAIVVATPQALHGRPDRRKGKLLVIHQYDWQEVRATLERWVSECERPTWEEVCDCLRTRFGWEYEGYAPK